MTSESSERHAPMIPKTARSNQGVERGRGSFVRHVGTDPLTFCGSHASAGRVLADNNNYAQQDITCNIIVKSSHYKVLERRHRHAIDRKQRQHERVPRTPGLLLPLPVGVDGEYFAVITLR